jgi:hypothetical protein
MFGRAGKLEKRWSKSARPTEYQATGSPNCWRMRRKPWQRKQKIIDELVAFADNCETEGEHRIEASTVFFTARPWQGTVASVAWQFLRDGSGLEKSFGRLPSDARSGGEETNLKKYLDHH